MRGGWEGRDCRCGGGRWGRERRERLGHRRARGGGRRNGNGGTDEAAAEHGEAEGGGRNGAAGFGEDHRALDRVLKFADVAGPWIRGEGDEGGFGEAGDLQAVFAGAAAEEGFGEDDDVFGAFSERWYLDGEYVEAVVEVGAEVAFFHELHEVAIGGGEEADVDLDGLGAADALEFAFLKNAQELGLKVGRYLAHFVEEERAAVGEFEAAFTAVGGAGEGAFFMTEEFALDEVFRESGAVDFDVGLVATRGVAVELAGDHFFAGAVFASDEDGGIGGSNAFDELAETLHGWALAQQIALAAVLLAEVAVNFDQLAVGVGFFENDFNLAGREGLDEIVEGTGAHTRYGAFDGAVAGHHDDEWAVGQSADAFEELLAVAIGQADIEHDEVEGFLC